MEQILKNRAIEIREYILKNYPDILEDSRGNIGLAKINIGNIYVDSELKAFSKFGNPNFKDPNKLNNAVEGFENVKPIQIFKTYYVNKDGEVSDTYRPGYWDRKVDTESKILEEVSSKLGDNLIAEGTIDLFTELPVCPSCDNVINSFSLKYPKVQIYVYNGKGNLFIKQNGRIKLKERY